MTAKLQSDKEKFIKQHKIKKSQSEALGIAAANTKLGADSVLQIPRKHSRNSDDDDGDLAALE